VHFDSNRRVYNTLMVEELNGTANVSGPMEKAVLASWRFIVTTPGTIATYSSPYVLRNSFIPGRYI